MFDTIPMHATVVIGEGEMDEAPMLYIGEELGLRNGGPEVDIAVDPLEGTNIVAKGTNGAMTVLAIADRGNLLNAPDMYMEKIAVGPEAAGKVDINASVTYNLLQVAKAKTKMYQMLLPHYWTVHVIRQSSMKSAKQVPVSNSSKMVMLERRSIQHSMRRVLILCSVLAVPLKV